MATKNHVHKPERNLMSKSAQIPAFQEYRYFYIIKTAEQETKELSLDLILYHVVSKP